MLHPEQGYIRFSKRPESILLIAFYEPNSVPAIEGNIAYIQKLLSFPVTVLNLFEHRVIGTDTLQIPSTLNLNAYKGIVIHAAVAFYIANLFALDKALSIKLCNYQGLKVLIKQDDHHQFYELAQYIRNVEFDLILTLVPPSEVHKVYRPEIVGAAQIEHTLAAYVTPAMRARPKFDNERSIDIGYRGSIMPLSFGRLCYEKRKIGYDVARLLAKKRLHLNISSRSEDRIGGDDWFKFLSSCKAVLGVEGGSGIFDLDGSLNDLFKEIECEIGPFSEEEAYAEAYLSRLAEFEGKDVKYFMISPRHFEAISTGTLQLLFGGHYTGRMISGRHYYELKRDYSNLEEAVDLILDPLRRNEFVTAAYEEVLLNPDNWIETFVARMDQLMSELFEKKGIVTRAQVTAERTGKNVVIVQAHEYSHDPRRDRWIEKCAPEGILVHQIGISTGRLEPCLLRTDSGNLIQVLPYKYWTTGCMDYLVTQLSGTPNADVLNELYFLSYAVALDDAQLAAVFAAPLSSIRLDLFRDYLRYLLNTTSTLIDTLLKTTGIHAIVAINLPSLLPALLAKGILNVPVIYEALEYWPEQDPEGFDFEIQFWQGLEKRLVNHTDFRGTVTPGIASLLEDLTGLPFYVVPNSVPLGDAAKDVTQARPSDRCRFIFQGNFAPYRGLELLISAWKRTNDNAVLMLRGPNNSYKAQLKKLAKTTGILNDRIFFLDAVDTDVLIQSAKKDGDIGLVPYTPRGENYSNCSPNKLGQYLAAGLPILANKTNFVSQIIKESGAGIVVDFNNTESLVTAVDRFSQDYTFRKVCGVASNHYFIDSYNWESRSRPLYDAICSATVNAEPAVLELHEDRVFNALISPDSVKYEIDIQENRYWQAAHHLCEVDLAMLTERISNGQAQPQFTFVIKATHAALAALVTTLQSLQQQHYSRWCLIVLADFPPPDSMSSDNRMRWLELAPLTGTERLTHALNAALMDFPGNWIALLPVGAALTPDCLLRLADTVQSLAYCQALYTDHYTLPLTGNALEAQFKPDFNLAYLLSWDYIGAACWFRQQALRQLNDFVALVSKQSYELVLRIVEHYGESAVGHLAYPLLHLPQEPVSYLAYAEQQQAIERYLARAKRQGEVNVGAQPGLFQLSYPLTTQPLVSIIIPNRNQRELLEPCIQSLLDNTAYEHFEILIIDNQSDDSDILDYYRQIQALHPQRIRVFDHDAPFNLSGKYNFGAYQAHGEYLLLLHNDIEAIAPDWLERMLMHAQHPEIGAVGAKLVYPNTDRVQHGGIVLGGGPKLLNLAAHYGTECKLDDTGYMNRLQCDLYLSAVSGACMLVRREVYTQLGGFNPELSGACNDIEFCLRLGQAGYKLLWTPYAVLRHRHGIDPKAYYYHPKHIIPAIPNSHERACLLTRWLPQLANDPAYNRNLSLRGTPLTLDQAPPLSWVPNFGERPKIFIAATIDHCVNHSLSALSDAGLAQTYCMPLNDSQMPRLLEIARIAPDVIVVQDGLNERYVESLRDYKKYFAELLRIVTLDGLPTRASALNASASRTYRECLSLIDRVIVPTAPLAALVGKWIDDIHLVPTCLSKAKWWGLPTRRQIGPKPRVGWVGLSHHDLEVLYPLIDALAMEVDWVCMGIYPKALEASMKEKHSWVPYENYPNAMASLNLDLALAPLTINAFNECQSNVRLLEYGAMGWPVICSDILPYQENQAPVTRVANTTDAWVKAIRTKVHDLDAAFREGEALRAWVKQHYLLEDHLEQWVKAYSC